MKNVCVIIACVFTTIVSIIAAIQVEQLYLKVILIASALISFTLAIARVCAFIKLEKRIKDLENNQISTEFVAEIETPYIKEGKENGEKTGY